MDMGTQDNVSDADPNRSEDDDNLDRDGFGDNDDDDDPESSAFHLSREDLDNFLTIGGAPDVNMDGIPNDPPVDGGENDLLPTTHAGEAAYEIDDANNLSGCFNNVTISGHVLLNQVGTLLTRQRTQIKGSSRHHNMLQRLCANNIGSSIPINQPEAMLFPSTFWKMVPNEHVVLGAIPAALLSESITKYGFQSLPAHVRTRLLSPFAQTSTDPRYIAFAYDMLTNLSATHLDTRVAMNRGLTAADDTCGGLGVRGGNDSASGGLLGSIDSSQMVKNLCASEKYHPKDYFVTLTCNQLCHFGTKIVKEWIDSEDCINEFYDYKKLLEREKAELRKAMCQAASGLLLRNWQEVCELLIDFLRYSSSSPFKKVGSIFSRNEYQKSVGNLSHIHLILQVEWSKLTEEENEFVRDLIRADTLSIPRDRKDIDELIDEGLLKCHDCGDLLKQHAETFLAHRCNERCQERISVNEYRCRKPNYAEMSPNPLKHHMLKMKDNTPSETKEVLSKIDLCSQEAPEDNGYQKPAQYKHPMFNPSRHVPPINIECKLNISPVELRLFALCRSMQNVQLIRGTGGCNKYICKYIAKIDEQNYVVVCTYEDKNGKLITKSQFLHNTKVAGSKHNEDKAREGSRESSRPQGRMISLMEMLHVMLKYPEVLTDLKFVSIPTVPLELRARVGISADKVASDEAFTIPEIVEVRTAKVQDQAYRQLTEGEIITLNDLRLSQYSVDRITQFSLRPPELRSLFDSVGNYFRWFHIDGTKPVTGADLELCIMDDLEMSSFIDGLQRRVKLRETAFDEVRAYLTKVQNESTYDQETISPVINMIRKMITLQKDARRGGDIEDTDVPFHAHCVKNIIDVTHTGHLPVPVYSFTKPTSVHKFVLHVLLSMGRYATESSLTKHASLRECFRHAKLVGPSNDPVQLQMDSDSLLLRFIIEQLAYFTNQQRVLNHWITLTCDIFDSVIVKDELLVTDMPSVQISTIMQSMDEEHVAFRLDNKKRIIAAAMEELGVETTTVLPNKDDLLKATKAAPVTFDPIQCFKKSPLQSEASYSEQKLGVELIASSLTKYSDITRSLTLTKNIGIRGFPGGGKTYCCLYGILYATSLGLNCLTTAVMAKRASALGGTHWAKFFCLPSDDSKNLTPQRQAELAINKIMKNPLVLNAILALDVIFADELGQLSAEFIATINIILCRIRCNSSFFGGVLLIGSFDHTQIQPWSGKPFLASPLLIPIFSMVKLIHSVRTDSAANYRMQSIARMDHSVLESSRGTDEDLIEEFATLARENFTFVPDWNAPEIDSSTFRVYSKRVPVAVAGTEFVTKVRCEYQTKPHELIIRTAEDTFKMTGTRASYRVADPETISLIDRKTKVACQLCFFRGAIFECTFNFRRTFRNADSVLLYDLPDVNDVASFKKIKVLKIPPGWKTFSFDMTKDKTYFINLGFEEITIPLHPEYAICSRTKQCIRKQYSLRHKLTATIHGAMGHTYERMASQISHTDPDFGLCDKGQLVVIISRTRDPKHTIFVGNTDESIETLKKVLLKKTQWSDYISDLLNIVTVNEVPRGGRVLTPTNFPFRIRDMQLPDNGHGIVYMLNSLRRRSYIYIGKTLTPRTRLNNHNSGYGATATEPCYLRPFAVMAYIAGFDGNNELMLAAENKWKVIRNQLIHRGEDDAREWARQGSRVINDSTLLSNYSTDAYDLRLVLLFHDD